MGASPRDCCRDSALFERDAVGRLKLEDGLSRMLGKNSNRVVKRMGLCGGGNCAAGGSGEKEVGEMKSEDDVFVV